jgi:hypothetical protein
LFNTLDAEGAPSLRFCKGGYDAAENGSCQPLVPPQRFRHLLR